MQANKRLIHFDVLKGVAILLVIWGHVYYFGLDHYTNNAMYTFIGAVHIPLFAMLSGFFFTKPLDLSRGGVISFWKDKAIRLLLPLLILPSLYNWIKYGFSVRLPLNMYLGEYWFTYTLFAIFIIFYLYRLLLMFGTRSYSILSISLGLAVIFGLYFGVEWTQSHYLNWYNRLNLKQLEWLYKYFWLGYLLGNYPKLEQAIRNEMVSAILFIAFCALLYLEYSLGYKIMYGIPLTTTGLLALYAIVYKLTASYGRITQTLAYLGKESLPIYLTHYFFIFNLTFLRPLLAPETVSVIGWEILIGCIASGVILLPTLLLIRLIKSNRYLALIIYGEKHPKVTIS